MLSRLCRPLLLPRILLVGVMASACGGKSGSIEADHPSLDKGSDASPSFFLGDDSTPLGYELFIEADPREAHFEGRVIIDVELARSLPALWLHQRDLVVREASFTVGTEAWPLHAEKAPHDDELLGLRSERPLPAGKGKLDISFRGSFRNIQGFFRQAHRGQWYAYTDFEAIDARAAFPCYDEPRFKVPWTLHIKAPEGQLAFANAPERAREEQDDGSTWFHFDTSTPLPTYLVAFAVGPFDTLVSADQRVPIRIIAPKGEAQRGRFVLENSHRWLAYLEDYFAMEVPYPKLDLIAVPHFGGAMENPGLITYSANILLTGNSPSEAEKRRAAGVTAHEFAHLWFGDLVTLDHWKNLWLNEGFATWMSDKVVANWQPGKAREVLDIADKTTAYALDHSLQVSPLRSKITSRKDMGRIFDAITYRKGGALVTMLEGWLGEAAMKEAMRAYVRAHRHGNVDTENLLGALESATDKEVRKLIPNFIDSEGIATLSVSLECEGKPTLRVRQERQLPVGVRDEDAAGPRFLPMCVRYPEGDGSERACFVVDEMEERFVLDTPACPSWLQPNDKEEGYYHYHLEAAGFEALWTQGKLDPRERWSYLHHLLASVSSRRLRLSEALPLLEKSYSSERGNELGLVLQFLSQLGESVIGPVERPAYEGYLQRHFGKRSRELGASERANDRPVDTELRPLLLTTLGIQGGDKEIRAMAKAAVKSWLDKPSAINPSHLLALLRIAAVEGEGKLYSAISKAQRRNDSNTLGLVLKAGLYSFSGDEFLQRHLETLRKSPLHPALIEALVGAINASPRAEDWVEVLISDAEDMRQQSKAPEDHPAFKSLALLLGQLCRETAVEPLAKFGTASQEARWAQDQLQSCLAFRQAHRTDAQRLFSGTRSTHPNP